MRKELKLSCEAKLKAFEECGLLKEIPCLPRNALRVYDQVKHFCTSTGSTYMEKGKLEKIMRKAGLPDDQVWQTLPFLRNLHVMMWDKQKVVLQKLHEYESGIADSLRNLVDAEQWTIPVNPGEVLYAYALKCRVAKAEKDPTADLSALSPVKVDPFQLQAAEMMCSNPVTVVSGKGGCGKTTVVSLVFRAAVEKERSVSGRSADAEDPRGDPGEDAKGHFRGDEPPTGGGGFPDPGRQPGTPDRGKEKRQDKLLEEHILLTAPTGRAASLLSKKTGFEAFTLHQVGWL